MPCHSHSDLAYVGDKIVSPGSICIGNNTAFSEGLVTLDDGSLNGSEESVGESSPPSCTEFMSQPQDHNPPVQHRLNLTEGHFAINLPESEYMYHLAFDKSMSLSQSGAENRTDDVTCQSEVAFDTFSSRPATEVAVADSVISAAEEESIIVEISAEEMLMHEGCSWSAASGDGSQTETISVGDDTEATAGHIPRTCMPTPVDSNCDQSAISESVSDTDHIDVSDTDHIDAATTAVRMLSEQDTAIIVADTDNLQCKQSYMNVENKFLDHDWDGSPSDVGDEDSVPVCGASGVTRIVPVTTVSLANTAREMDVVMSASKQADVTDRDPNEGEGYCRSTVVSASDEELLVLVNFRVTADRYEGSTMASETRESFSRMVVRRSDVLPKTNWSWADYRSTENQQLYVVQKKKTNVVLGNESFMTAEASDRRLLDFSHTDQHNIRNVSDTTSDRLRQLAERSVTRVVKHVVVTKTETMVSDDSAVERKAQTEIRDAEDEDKHKNTWITEIVRGSSIETEDTGDSCVTDVGENDTTTGYMSVSENYEHEDVDDSFSSGHEETETITDMIVVDTALVVSGDDNIECTGVTEGAVDRTTTEAGDRELREVTVKEIYDDFPDNDDRKRGVAVEITLSDEAKVDHFADIHTLVELQETDVCEVTEVEPVDSLSAVSVSSGGECDNADVKISVVEHYVQITKADVDEAPTEAVSDISEIDTSVVRPDVYTGSKFTVPGTVVITNKCISVIEEDTHIRENEADDAGSDTSKHVELSKDLATADIEETGDVMLGKVSDIEETGIDNRTSVDHESELYDIVLKSKGVETFVQPVTYSDVICCETSAVSSFVETETCAVSPDVETCDDVDAAAKLEQRVEARTDAVICDLPAVRTDDTVTEIDETEKCSVYPGIVSNETCSAVTKQTESQSELQLADATKDDSVGETDSVEIITVCPVAEDEDVLDTAVTAERIKTHVGIAEDYTAADDELVIKADIVETVSPESLSYVIDSAVKLERARCHIDAITAYEAECAEPIEAPAILAGVVDNDTDEITYTAVMQNREETCVQPVVIADEAGSTAELSVTDFDDVKTCTVIPDIVTDETESVVYTAITPERIEISIDDVIDEQKEDSELVLPDEPNIAEICSLSADEAVANVLDISVKLEDRETCVGVLVQNICDDSNRFSEFSEPVACLVSHHILNAEAESVSAADVNAERTETYTNAIEHEDDDDVTEIRALNELEAFPIPCQTVCVESISNTAVNSERVDIQIEVIKREVSAGMNEMSDDDGCDNTLKEVKRGDVQMMSDAHTETCNGGQVLVTREKQSVACQTDADVADSLQQVGTTSVGLQTALTRVNAAAGTTELADEDDDGTVTNLPLDSRVFCERDVKTTQTEEDTEDAVISVSEAVDRMDLCSTAVQTDQLNSLSLCMVETQTVSHEMSGELSGNANALSVITADACTSTTIDVAVVETQTLPYKDDISTAEAQTSTAAVDLVAIDTQTVEYKGDTLMVEAETCTTPVEMTVVEIQTSLDKIDTSTAEAQTNTTAVDIAGTHMQTVDSNELVVDAETCTTPLDVAVVETQTLPYKEDFSTAEAETSTTPVDLVTTDSQTVGFDAVTVEAETSTTPVPVAMVETQTLPYKEDFSTAEAQTSTTPVDLVTADSQTVGYEVDTVTVEAETCTTPAPVAMVATQTSLDKENISAGTAAVDLVCVDTQTVEYTADTVTVDAETCTTAVDAAVVATQTLMDIDDTLTADAQTCTVPVDLVVSDTHVVDYEGGMVTIEAGTCTTPVNIAVVETQTSLDKVASSTAEAQTSTTPVDLVMVDTQTVWIDDNDAFSHLATHYIDSALVQVPQINQPLVDDSVGHDVENPIIDNFPDVVPQVTNESEVSDSSSESIYLEDYSSSTETSFTDANEDFEDTSVPDTSVKTDPDEVGAGNISDDKHSQLSDSEYTDALSEDVYLQECDSSSVHSVGDDVDHNGASEMEMLDLGDTRTLSPPSSALLSVGQRQVGPDVEADVSTQNQVNSVAGGCGDCVALICMLCFPHLCMFTAWLIS